MQIETDMSRILGQKLIKNLIFHNFVYKNCFKRLRRNSFESREPVMIYAANESLHVLNILTILFLAHVDELSLGMLIRSNLKVELIKVFGTNGDLF